MPSKRTRLGRVVEGELDEGQRAFLLGEEPAEDAGLWPFNRWCWLWNAVERREPGPLPDSSPSPRDLWAMFGKDALELWHRAHGDEEHPLVEYLGIPDAGPRG